MPASPLCRTIFEIYGIFPVVFRACYASSTRSYESYYIILDNHIAEKEDPRSAARRMIFYAFQFSVLGEFRG